MILQRLHICILNLSLIVSFITGVPTPANTCDQPKSTGPCLAYIPRFYFNSKTGKCEKFVFGGCQGNSNNFKSLSDCQATCANSCNLPKKVGPCLAAFPRYYFDIKSGKCHKFIYGGCQGNGNNFVMRSECEKRCGNNSGMYTLIMISENCIELIEQFKKKEEKY
jgi:hypothetical protein